MSSASSSTQGEGNRKRARAQNDDGGRERRRSTTLGRSREADAATDATAEPITVGEVHVGTGLATKKWQVHIDRFSAMSPFLQKAFRRAFVDDPAAVPTVKMPDEDPRIFQWIHDWIYAASFSGLGNAPVPLINGPGDVIKQKGGIAADADKDKGDDAESDDEVVITGVKSIVQNPSDPLGIAKREEAEAVATPATSQQPTPDVPTQVKPESDVEVVAGPANITPRDLMELYILAKKLEIYPLGNAAMDVLHGWFHPDAEKKRRGPNAEASPALPPATAAARGAGANPNTPDEHRYQPVKPLPFRRVPYLTDVAYVFAKTPEDNSLRRLLIATCVMCVFSPRPAGRKLPDEWKEVLCGDGEIGWAMLKFVAAMKWTHGKDTPKIIPWPRHSFHEAAVNIKIDDQ